MTLGMLFTLIEHQFPYLYNRVNDITYIIDDITYITDLNENYYLTFGIICGT